jgi:hypothetical protein
MKILYLLTNLKKNLSSMKTAKWMMMLVAFLFVAQAGFSQAKPKPKKELNVESKTVAYEDKNPNVKGEMPTDDNVKKEDTKIGAKAGSGYGNCYVYVTNYTAFTINVYLDGYYAGTMGPYGSLNAVTGTGYTTCYGISAGGTTEWSTSGNCSYDYTFKFTE